MLSAQRALTGLAAPALLHENPARALLPGAPGWPAAPLPGESAFVRLAEAGAEEVEFVKRRCVK